jgi:hypothetical protein
MTSAMQISANQANAQLSTGPTSDAGKAKSSLNAITSGLTGATVLLPTDEVAAYEAHVASVVARYSPVGAREQALAQSIANAEWRVQRIEGLEFGIYAQGNIEFAPDYASQPENLRPSLIKTKTFFTYEQLRNLRLQEDRIRRHRENNLDELFDLQAKREAELKAIHGEQVTVVAKSLIKAYKAGTEDKWSRREIGFEFSPREVANRLYELRPDLLEVLPVFDQMMAS